MRSSRFAVLATLLTLMAAVRSWCGESIYGDVKAANGNQRSRTTLTASPEQPKLYLIEVRRKRGFIDSMARVVIPLMFDNAHDFSDGLAAVELNGHWGFIDASGNFVIPARFQDAGYFVHGLAPVKEHGWWGFINKHGEYISSSRFHSVDCSWTDFPVVDQGYYIDPDNMTLFHHYDRTKSASCFHDGLAYYEDEDGLVGYLNEKDEIAIAPQFRWAQPFFEGLASVKLSETGKWGYINTSGEMVIPAQFDSASPFIGGTAAVNVNGKTGFIRRDGSYILPPSIPDPALNAFSLGHSRFALNNQQQGSAENKYAILDEQGNQLTPFVFTTIDPFVGPVAAVTVNGDNFSALFTDTNGRILRFSDVGISSMDPVTRGDDVPTLAVRQSE